MGVIVLVIHGSLLFVRLESTQVALFQLQSDLVEEMNVPYRLGGGDVEYETKDRHDDMVIVEEKLEMDDDHSNRDNSEKSDFRVWTKNTAGRKQN